MNKLAVFSMSLCVSFGAYAQNRDGEPKGPSAEYAERTNRQLDSLRRVFGFFEKIHLLRKDIAGEMNFITSRLIGLNAARARAEDISQKMTLQGDESYGGQDQDMASLCMNTNLTCNTIGISYDKMIANFRSTFEVECSRPDPELPGINSLYVFGSCVWNGSGYTFVKRREGDDITYKTIKPLVGYEYKGYKFADYCRPCR